MKSRTYKRIFWYGVLFSIVFGLANYFTGGEYSILRLVAGMGFVGLLFISFFLHNLIDDEQQGND